MTYRYYFCFIQYPGWLADNKDKLSASDHTRYSTQFGYIKEICTVLEAEKETDSEESKRQRFENVLDLMQKVKKTRKFIGFFMHI